MESIGLVTLTNYKGETCYVSVIFGDQMRTTGLNSQFTIEVPERIRNNNRSLRFYIGQQLLKIFLGSKKFDNYTPSDKGFKYCLNCIIDAKPTRYTSSYGRLVNRAVDVINTFLRKLGPVTSPESFASGVTAAVGRLLSTVSNWSTK